MAATTNVYVDGFNLYFGAVKNTPYRWLDILRLSQGLLRADHTVHRIRYFTARVTARSDDPTVVERQATFLRALRTLPNLTIHYGMFLTNPTNLLLADGTGRTVRVLRTEEKGSDVNLATYLLLDAFDRDFQTALVISNDSDLVEPIVQVRQRFGLVVGVSCPVYHQDRHPSFQLVAASDFNVHITKKRKKLLRECQFPAELEDEHGKFRKPDGW